MRIITEFISYHPDKYGYDECVVHTMYKNAEDDEIEYFKAIELYKVLFSANGVAEVDVENNKLRFRLIYPKKEKHDHQQLINTFVNVKNNFYDEEIEKFRKLRKQVLAMSELRAVSDFMSSESKKDMDLLREIRNLQYEMKLLKEQFRNHCLKEETKKKPGRPKGSPNKQKKLNEEALGKEVKIIENMDG